MNNNFIRWRLINKNTSTFITHSGGWSWIYAVVVRFYQIMYLIYWYPAERHSWSEEPCCKSPAGNFELQLRPISERKPRWWSVASFSKAGVNLEVELASSPLIFPFLLPSCWWTIYWSLNLERCKFEHPGQSSLGSGNRFGVLSGGGGGFGGMPSFWFTFFFSFVLHPLKRLDVSCSNLSAWIFVANSSRDIVSYVIFALRVLGNLPIALRTLIGFGIN